jgi:glycosyltransferase involved in cell wall biosynthesis
MSDRQVVVLLSTFNAGPFLGPLIESVLSQEKVSVRLVIRDDGSTDQTPVELRRWAERDDVSVEYGTNFGPCRSYFRLLSVPANPGELVALCDQDDVWLPGKLAAAHDALQKFGQTPALYCGRLAIVDESLRQIGLSSVPRRELAVPNALVENAVMGPTVVMNEVGRALLAQHCPRFAVMHDAWAYLVFSALGHIVYDGEPRVLYRLHQGNRVGLSKSFPGRAWRLVRRRAREYFPQQLQQAKEFESAYGTLLSSKDRATVERFCREPAYIYERLQLALGGYVYRQRTIDNMLLRLVLLLRLGIGSSAAACPAVGTGVGPLGTEKGGAIP